MKTIKLADALSMAQSFDKMYISELSKVESIMEMPLRKDKPKEKDYTALNNTKKKEVKDVFCMVDLIGGHLVELKGIINRRNTELGIDKLLAEQKNVLVALSSLMKVVKGDRYGFSGKPGYTLVKFTGISDEIRRLETEKRRLQSSINMKNWMSDIEVPEHIIGGFKICSKED